VTFIQGDACNLPTGIGPFDIVLMANLIDRLHSPEQILTAIGPLMNEGGILSSYFSLYLDGTIYPQKSLVGWIL
jgi:ubiquinone/menaquinone biosynthesis C-methylase UbiE